MASAPTAQRELEHFQRVRQGIDPSPFLEEIASVPDAWNLNNGRQSKIIVQSQARSIPIRGLRKSAIAGRERSDVHESRYTGASKLFPYVTAFLRSFALEAGGELSRAKLVCLPPGHRVLPHIDRGEYYAQRDRFHLALQTSPGTWLKAGEERVELAAGELWKFDNKQVHDLQRQQQRPDSLHL